MITIQEAQSNPLIFDKFISENMGLVYSVVGKFNNYAEYDDYFQCGCMGLLKAAQRYKPEFGVVFSTYAVPMIEGEIKRYRRDYHTLKISRPIRELGNKITYMRSRGYTEEQICCELNIAIEDIKKSDTACQKIRSFSETVCESTHGEMRALEDTLASDINIEADVTGNIEIKEKLQILKGLLSEEYFKVFALYLEGKTQNEIAKVIGVTQVQISRIQRKIFKLCNQINSDYETGTKTIAKRFKLNKNNRNVKEVIEMEDKVQEVKFNRKTAEELLKDGESPDYIASKFAHQFNDRAKVPKMLMAKWGLTEGKSKTESKKGKKVKGQSDKSLLKAEVMAGKVFRYKVGSELEISKGEDKLPCTYEELPRLILELQEIQRSKQEAV